MIYTNLEAVKSGKHGMFESSKLESTDTGNIYDIVVQDENGKEIDVDNGVAVHVGEYTGNGLQERCGTIAKVTEKIAVTGAPPLVKDAFTTAQAQPYNYFNIAGNPVKTYEVVEDGIFAVADFQFTDESTSNVVEKAFVTVDGNGTWVAQKEKPTGCGFIGQIHSFAVGNFYRMVRIVCIQNEDYVAPVSGN